MRVVTRPITPPVTHKNINMGNNNYALAQAQNVQIVVSLSELKEVVLETLQEARKEWQTNQGANAEATPASDEFLTADEVCNLLKVTRPTLWRWDKTGFLKKKKAGSNVLYKKSDIMAAIERRAEA